MSSIDYHRPDSLQKALELLPGAQPLAGGTALTPRRSEITAVVDLQQLGFDGLGADQGSIWFGATCKLQALVDASGLPAALIQAANLEAPVNLRNMATVAGTIVACDGRSPLVAVLLALDAVARLAPGDSAASIDALLEARPQALDGRLITRLEMRPPAVLRYEQVARSLKDRPIVCAALGGFEGKGGRFEFRLALGGHGSRPVRVPPAEAALQRGDPEAAAAAASAAYARAGDEWASAEYRAHVAAVLTRRLAQEVVR
jgi:probable selenate reductase FAD-binding subunit